MENFSGQSLALERRQSQGFNLKLSSIKYGPIPPPFSPSGEKVAGGRMRGLLHFCDSTANSKLHNLLIHHRRPPFCQRLIGRRSLHHLILAHQLNGLHLQSIESRLSDQPLTQRLPEDCV